MTHTFLFRILFLVTAFLCVCASAEALAQFDADDPVYGYSEAMIEEYAAGAMRRCETDEPQDSQRTSGLSFGQTSGFIKPLPPLKPLAPLKPLTPLTPLAPLTTFSEQRPSVPSQHYKPECVPACEPVRRTYCSSPASVLPRCPTRSRHDDDYDDEETTTTVTITYPSYATRSGKQRGGNLFAKQKVTGILRNPVYIGRMRWGDEEHDGNHSPIISKQQFERAQQMLGQIVKKRMNLRKPTLGNRQYLLSGLLRCSCGAHMTGAVAQPPITLVYGTVAGQIGLMLQCTQAQQALVLDPITANYPYCSFTGIEEPEVPVGCVTWSRDVTLRPELFPILRHAQFEDLLNHNFADPVSSLLRAIRPETSLECRVEISILPAAHWRCHAAAKSIRRLDREFFRHHHRLAAFYARNIQCGRWQWLAWILGRIALRSSIPGHTLLETSTSRLHEREEDLQGAADKIGGHLFEARLRVIVHAPPEQHTHAAGRLQGMLAAFGAFTKSRMACFHAGPIRTGASLRRGPSFLLSHEELATLWHPPTATAAAEKMQNSDFTEREAPAVFHSDGKEGGVILGRVQFRDDRRAIPLALEDRRRHLYICGKTGMGKTTLIQNMIVSDMLAGRGVCLVDPHGDLAESIVALVPRQRTNDVIYFDAADRSVAIPFNPLACRDPARIDQVTSGIVSAFKKLHDSWGPRLEDTLRNAVFATVEQGGNLLSVMRLLGEQAYREQTVVRIRDEVVRSFWMHEFANWSDNYRTEAVAAIQNKLRPFVVSTNM